MRRGGPPRALHLAYSHYESDPRTRRQAEALRDAGWDVTVICLGRPGVREPGQVDGVRLRTVTVPRYRGRSLLRYLRSYGRFLWRAALDGARGEPFDFVHVHSLPDFAVHAAWPARWRGAAVLLDIHDLVPELFEERFGAHRRTLLGITRIAERLNGAAAHHVLTANEQFRERLVARGTPAAKVSINLNLPDERIFWREPPPPPPATPVLAYHGTFVPRYGPDLVLEAAARLVSEFPDLRVRLIGDGDQRGVLEARAAAPDLAGRVEFSADRVAVPDIPAALGAVTVGMVANRPEGFSRLVLPTKLLEYLALGIPTVVTRTATLDYYFRPDELVTVERPDPGLLAAATAGLLRDPALAAERLRRGRAFFDRHGWREERASYVALALRLTGRGTGEPA